MRQSAEKQYQVELEHQAELDNQLAVVANQEKEFYIEKRMQAELKHQAELVHHTKLEKEVADMSSYVEQLSPTRSPTVSNDGGY